MSELLFLAQYRYGVRLEYPSIAVWITNRQRIILWLPSMCHKAFGHRTLYCRRRIVPLHRSAVPTGSSSRISYLTFHRCTYIPLLYSAPSMRVCMISPSSPSLLEVQFCSSFIWNSCLLLLKVLVEIPSSSAILTLEKCN